MMTSRVSETAAEARIADMAVRYRELSQLMNDAQKEKTALAEVLKDYIREMGEPIEVEGLPALCLKERATQRTWDTRALAAQEAAEFARMLEMGAVTVDGRVADALLAKGQLSGMHRRFAFHGTTEALVWDERR